MGNELKDIANKLCPYDSLNDGWSIISAEKLTNGNWNLQIEPHRVENEKPEEANEQGARS